MFNCVCMRACRSPSLLPRESVSTHHPDAPGRSMRSWCTAGKDCVCGYKYIKSTLISIAVCFCVIVLYLSSFNNSVYGNWLLLLWCYHVPQSLYAWNYMHTSWLLVYLPQGAWTRRQADLLQYIWPTERVRHWTAALVRHGLCPAL